MGVLCGAAVSLLLPVAVPVLVALLEACADAVPLPVVVCNGEGAGDALAESVAPPRDAEGHSEGGGVGAPLREPELLTIDGVGARDAGVAVASRDGEPVGEGVNESVSAVVALPHAVPLVLLEQCGLGEGRALLEEEGEGRGVADCAGVALGVSLSEPVRDRGGDGLAEGHPLPLRDHPVLREMVCVTLPLLDARGVAEGKGEPDDERVGDAAAEGVVDCDGEGEGEGVEEGEPDTLKLRVSGGEAEGVAQARPDRLALGDGEEEGERDGEPVGVVVPDAVCGVDAVARGVPPPPTE